MAHISTESVGDILDNYADAIEGGNSYRGSGTSYGGIPGLESNDDGLRNGSDGSITASANGTTTTIVYGSGTWATSRWVKSETPSFYAVCTSAANEDNEGAARKITNWALGTTTFTTIAFPSATTSGDVFTVLQGFKRLPNTVDIENEETEVGSGWDRFFRLDMLPGEPTEFYGSGVRNYSSVMNVRLRLLKYGRDRDARDSVLANLRILRDGIVDSSHTGGSTLIRAAIPENGTEDILTDDANKVVGQIGVRVYYRVSTTFL